MGHLLRPFTSMVGRSLPTVFYLSIGRSIHSVRRQQLHVQPPFAAADHGDGALDLFLFRHLWSHTCPVGWRNAISITPIHRTPMSHQGSWWSLLVPRSACPLFVCVLNWRIVVVPIIQQRFHPHVPFLRSGALRHIGHSREFIGIETTSLRGWWWCCCCSVRRRHVRLCAFHMGMAIN